MPWLLPRLVALVLGTWAGMVLGAAAGEWIGKPTLGMVVGAGAAVVAMAVLDALRARRLIEWLRRSSYGAPPVEDGLWSELTYRAERQLRLRERALEQEQERLAQFLQAMDASPNGVLLLDADGQIDWGNAVAADHFGIDPVRDRGQRLTNLVRTPAFVDYLQQEGNPAQPVVVPSPLGRQTLSVLVRRYGDKGLTLVISQDVTQRERHDAMRRDFVANVSHEMRTPLTVLSGFIETLSVLPLTEVERRRVLKLMGQQTTRMQALLTDLLALAQLEGSPRPPADQWTAVEPLMKQVRADGEALSAGRHDLHFHLEEGGDIAGSASELLSAVGNLVGNAVRYTPDGGRIDVSWRIRPDGAGEIDVVDTGVGIEREHLPRLTERFYRVDSSRSRDTGGTGLGLSIVKHVIQRHGGEIEIDSQPGKGSRFRLVLPASRVRVRRETPVLLASDATR
ncbi:MAG: phosphate regulon sensor histidine kinase PhoR [Ideonella sp.]|jgi:two-component system phosphate regulon sensor histidine kinase PhoR|nr:phosphate regulon sensor histidine kinase PhoR [Ideonella sp.]